MQTRRAATIETRNKEENVNSFQNDGPVLTGKKFMLTLRETVFKELQKSADQRGVTIQGLIRAVIVPEWHLEHTSVLRSSSSLGQEQLRESVSVQTWPKVRKAVVDDMPTKVVA